jgi:phosphoribosylanthranilate isomerase
LNEGRVKVKVCGLTEVANALACAEAGAEWIGLNFHPSSPRSISVDRGAEIAFELMRKTQACAVGLFVDRPWEEVAEIATEAGLGTIQLHGEEPPEYLLHLQRYKSPLKAIRAFRLSDTASVDRMISYLDRADQLGCPPGYLLVDAHVPGQPGGTGQSIGFDVLAHLPSHPRLILAGGLTPENVAERVALVRPWMVDVASGVESSPGVKDPVRVAAFVAAAKAGASRPL